MIHAKGIRGYFTRCKANGIDDWNGIRIQEAETFTGTTTDDLESVNCPNCLNVLPPALKKALPEK